MKCPLCQRELTPAALEDFICPTHISFDADTFIKQSHYSLHTTNQLQVCSIPPFRLHLYNGKSYIFYYNKETKNFGDMPIVLNEELKLDSPEKLYAKLKTIVTFS
jgi:hypothetical protein